MNEEYKPAKTEEDPYKYYNDILKEMKGIESKDENYSEEKSPTFPEDGVTKLIQGKSIFVGLGKETGVAEFCFGKQKSGDDIHKDEYRYFSQDIFNEMVKKLKLAYEELERINGATKTF